MKLIIALATMTFVCTAVTAQQTSNNPETAPVTITGKIANGTPKDTFQVIFWKEYIDHLIDVDIMNVPLDDAGNFGVTLPPIGHIARIAFQKKGTEFANLGNFAAEPGDSIHMSITKTPDDYQIIFSGKGHEKYSLHAAYEECKDQFNRLRRTANALTNPQQHFSRLLKIADSMRLVIQRMLDTNQLSLSLGAYKFLSAEYAAYINHIVPLELKGFYSNSANKSSSIMRNQYMQFASGGMKPDSTYAAWSVDYLYTSIAIEQTMLFLDSRDNNYTFSQLYTSLQKKYSGLLREKLLLTALIDPAIKAECAHNDQAAFDICLKDAYTLVATPYIKNQLGKMLNIYSKGQPAYNFNLENDKGRFVRLSDFKGKVVLLDMWFTGCTGCMQFAAKMRQEIMPQFKDDTILKVVSISTDENKLRWLQSLSNSKYSELNDTNLYTGGMTFYDTPIVQYYQVQGMPFILLIDKNGNMDARISNMQPAAEIITIIKNALGQTVKN